MPDEGEAGERTAEKANAESLPLHKGACVAAGDRLFDACNSENCYRTFPTVQHLMRGGMALHAHLHDPLQTYSLYFALKDFVYTLCFRNSR